MKYINIIRVFLFILLFSSCNDWLDVEPKSTKPIGGKSYSDAVLSVNGTYAFLSGPYSLSGHAELPFSCVEVVTGQYFPDDAISQQIGTINPFNLVFSNTNTNFLDYWDSFYKGIEAANIAISTIPTIIDVELTDNERSRLLGEAHFLRAYYHFMLVQLFGEVPIKIESTISPSDGMVAKNEIKEVYETVIVPDLELAESSKMPMKSEEGRVSIGAVKSLLAKVYLTMAGFPLMQTDKYALARNKAKEVISSGEFSLFESDADGLSWFDKLNNSDFDNKEEHIFMVQYALHLKNSSMTNYFAPVSASGKISPGGMHLGGIRPTDVFFNSYNAADLRVQNKGFFFNEFPNIDGTGNVTFPLSVYKYFDNTFATTAPESGKNQPIIRYADILLVYAEAQNAADGSPNADAYAAINSVRNRAEVPILSGLSKSEFEEAVWKERAWELTCEGQVWFDMKRTQKAFNGSTFVNLIGYTKPNGKTISEDNIYFPIPQSEIDINPLLGE